MANLIDAYKRLLGRTNQPIKNTYQQVLSPSKSQLGQIDIKPSQTETLSRMSLMERAGYGLNKAIGEPIQNIYGKIPTKFIGENIVSLGKEIGNVAQRNLRTPTSALAKDLVSNVVPKSAQVGLQLGGSVTPTGLAGTALMSGLTTAIESVRNRDVGKGLLETQKQLPQLTELGAINALDPLSGVKGSFLKRNLIRGVGNVGEDLLASGLGVIGKPTAQQLGVSFVAPAGLDISGSVLSKFIPKGKVNLPEIEKQNIVGQEGDLVAIKTADNRLIVKDKNTGKIVKNPEVVKTVIDKVKFTVMGNKQPDLEIPRQVKKPKFQLPWDQRGEAQIGTLLGRPQEDSLLQEAKKYKSAEEFVKARVGGGDNVYYHGTTKAGADNIDKVGFIKTKGGFNKGRGVSVSKEYDISNEFASGGVFGKSQAKDGDVFRIEVDPKAKVVDMQDFLDLRNELKEGVALTSLDIKTEKARLGVSELSMADETRLKFRMANDLAYKEFESRGVDIIDASKRAFTVGQEQAESIILNPDIIKSKTKVGNKSQLTDIWNKANRTSERGEINIPQIMKDIRTKFVDFTAPIEDAVSKSEKEGKFKLLPQRDIRYQIDKVLRADSLGTQFIKDNGLDKIISGVGSDTDYKDFNQYLIAKQASDVANLGIKTGRNIATDQQLIAKNSDKFEPLAKQVYEYNNKLRQYLVSSGLISQELSDSLAREYPNYVPLQRVFNEVEEEALKSPTGRGGTASISSQGVVKRLKGSEREIKDPLESILENTALAFRQGERNKAAGMLGQYIQNGIIPGKELEGTGVGKFTVSFLDNGKKRTFEVDKDISEAAKNLNIEQLSPILRVLAVPTRVLQLGATGLNVPFVLSNLVKDQITASIVGDLGLRGTILNPINFVKALTSAVKGGDLYDRWVRSGAAFNSFDIARGQTPQTIAKIRSGASKVGKAKYLAKNPAEFLRAIEDVIGTTEQLTRIQQFKNTFDDLIKKGYNKQTAEILAGEASRKNTANFARKGTAGRVLNSLIPFFNAGIQGARSLTDSFKKNPVGASFRFASTVGVPIVATTLWNTTDPNRKKIYDDLAEYEKENNLIFVPDGATQDERGYYNVIKVPMTPGLSNLASIIRRQMESMGEFSPQEGVKILNDLFTATTSFDLPINADSSRQLVGQVTPQALKMVLEPTLNKNLFTGRDIVPFYMKNKPAEEQVYKTTSKTARLVGDKLGVSPLYVENAINTGGAGLGRQAINLVDRSLGATPNQVGGRSIAEDIVGRFSKARGGEAEQKAVAKLQDSVKKGQVPNGTALAGEKAYYTDKSGNIKDVELTVTLTPPKLTGNTELDKKLVSKYNGEVTSRINDVVNLFEQGMIDAKKAGDEITKLSRLKKLASGKVKKVKVKKPKKIKIRSPRKIKARKLRTPTLKPIKLKY